MRSHDYKVLCTYHCILHCHVSVESIVEETKVGGDEKTTECAPLE